MAIIQDKRLLKLPPSSFLPNVSGQDFFAPWNETNFTLNISPLNCTASHDWQKRLLKLEPQAANWPYNTIGPTGSDLPTYLWTHDTVMRARGMLQVFDASEYDAYYLRIDRPFGKSGTLLRSPKAVIHIFGLQGSPGAGADRVVNAGLQLIDMTTLSSAFKEEMNANNIYYGVIAEFDGCHILAGLPWSGTKTWVRSFATSGSTGNLYSKIFDPTMFLGGEVLFYFHSSSLIGWHMPEITTFSTLSTLQNGWQDTGISQSATTNYAVRLNTDMLNYALGILDQAIPLFAKVRWIFNFMDIGLGGATPNYAIAQAYLPWLRSHVSTPHPEFVFRHISDPSFTSVGAQQTYLKDSGLFEADVRDFFGI